MTTPVDRAPLQQLQQAAVPEAGGAAPKITPTPRWVPGLLAACAAIALAVRGPPPPPPGLDKHAYYFLALSAAFFAGVAGVMAAVWVSDDSRGRRAAGAGRLVVYSSVAALAVAAGLSVMASLIS